MTKNSVLQSRNRRLRRQIGKLRESVADSERMTDRLASQERMILDFKALSMRLRFTIQDGCADHKTASRTLSEMNEMLTKYESVCGQLREIEDPYAPEFRTHKS